jgi:general secretion pathway protein G
MRNKRRVGNGFSVLELLIAVGIIGIIAAIAMSNYYTALHKSKQKRTMADIRGIAVAWESRAMDAKQYNAAGTAFTMPSAILTHADMRTLLSPTYMGHVPQFDGWGNALEYALDQSVGSGRSAAEYAIRSGARDGQYQTTYDSGATTSFDCDIVYSNGSFIIWPEGAQN